MIERFAEQLIEKAKNKEISDIHIIPKKVGYRIYFRYVGQLLTVYTLTEDPAERLINYFKYISHMAVGEKRKPQSGSCLFSVRNELIELRTSTMSNFENRESLVIRLLNRENKLDVSVAHYFPKEVDRLYQLLNKKQGFIIFSGPVDSGKTTTIHKLLKRKYEEKSLEILTLEDPVEIRDDRFLQIQVQEEIGVGYDELIKASLRHHPDILMIGEIRDIQTAKMAVRATLTGHLVVATIHAKSCYGVIDRLLDLSITKNALKETVTGIVSQRLIPQYCPMCKGVCHLYCQHIPNQYKRLALTDMLCGEQLKQYFLNDISDQQFNQQLQKAFLLGYISENTKDEYLVT